MIITAHGLSKQFGTTTAVAELDLKVRRGEVFGFLGPNGAGKTTTVRMLTTVLTPTAGQAEVAGVAVTKANGPELRRRIGVMPESAGLYAKLSVQENLEFFAGIHGIEAGQAESRIATALAAAGLTDRRDSVAGTLTKGLKQSASLARTLLADPDVLFLDEPTAGLDPEATVEVRDLIESLRERGVTVFLTTHRLEEADRLCDRVAIFNTRLLTLGTPAELRQQMFGTGLDVRLRHPLPDPAALFGAVPGVSGWRVENGRYLVAAADPAAVAPELARALVGADADVLHLAEASRSLEETYLELIQSEES